jgi:tRNA 2-selenouridine synthase
MLKPIGIIEFIQLAKSGRILIDARSPKEFEQGHVPGALNLPLLNNEERHQVGITYKEHGRDAAVRLGFELVGHKFAHYIDTAKLMAPEGKILLYCWRGGIRSNTFGWLLSSAGMEVLLLEGGYKEYRQWCLSTFEHKWPLMVLSGKTGAGKTEILHELAHYGEGIVDLEALANHRGSAFGALGLSAQPTQETFENELAWVLHNCLSASRVWIENESRFIGKIRIPDSFFNQAGKADLISINRDVNYRAHRILQEYGQFDKELLAEKTRSITKRMGGDRVKASVEALENGDLLGWVLPLLDYYDRNYEHSIQVRSGKYERELNVQSQSAKEIARELLRLKTHS